MDEIGLLQERGRAEEQPIHDPEHRGVRPDTEGKGDEHGDRESRARAEATQCVARVAPCVIESHAG